MVYPKGKVRKQVLPSVCVRKGLLFLLLAMMLPLHAFAAFGVTITPSQQSYYFDRVNNSSITMTLYYTGYVDAINPPYTFIILMPLVSGAIIQLEEQRFNPEASVSFVLNSGSDVPNLEQDHICTATAYVKDNAGNITSTVDFQLEIASVPPPIPTPTPVPPPTSAPTTPPILNSGSVTEPEDSAEQQRNEYEKASVTTKSNASVPVYDTYTKNQAKIGTISPGADIALVMWNSDETWCKVIYNDGNNAGWIDGKHIALWKK